MQPVARSLFVFLRFPAAPAAQFPSTFTQSHRGACLSEARLYVFTVRRAHLNYIREGARHRAIAHEKRVPPRAGADAAAAAAERIIAGYTRVATLQFCLRERARYSSTRQASQSRLRA